MKEIWEKPQITNLELRSTQEVGAKMSVGSERTLIELGVVTESTAS